MKWNHTKFLMSAFLLSLVACSDDNTAGVTEDGNPAIAQGKSSSSAISSSGTGTTSTVDLWDGSAGEAHVNTGNKNVGNWYSFGDNTAGGLSMLRYPVNLDNEDSDNLSPVIQYCEGLCGTIELNNPVAAPWAGVGFAVAEEGSTADISACRIQGKWIWIYCSLDKKFVQAVRTFHIRRFTTASSCLFR